MQFKTGNIKYTRRPPAADHWHTTDGIDIDYRVQITDHERVIGKNNIITY